ncbi:hypothetical protein HPB50_017855 [Hyalomma asiaticum]|uniref:Uncharacterized protein n=1 Tax=Hyalomma asiaticum TaxID=266040 RepID=A0ACB7SPD4_HYAAI|nr:hypothetical protein HPB50_017855 [Hyalomma asiaticum]
MGQDQRSRSSDFSIRASLAMDLQIDAISKLTRERKVKAKLSFGSMSTGCSSSPCHLRANFTHLIAVPETPQEGEGDEHRPDLTVNATGKAGPITAIKTGENYEAESVHSIKPLATNCDVATSTLVHHPSSIEGDHRVITIEKRRPTGLTEADAIEHRETHATAAAGQRPVTGAGTSGSG